MSEPKQVIVVRNDLRSKLRHGKLAAQVAHASMAAFNGECKVYDFEDDTVLMVPLTKAKQIWITNSFAKVVLRCDNEDALLALRDLCVERNLPHALITDHGRTVFREPTTTCLGIGPVFPEELVGLTDELKMY